MMVKHIDCDFFCDYDLLININHPMNQQSDWGSCFLHQ
jgi:hypothetical protein